MPGSTGWNRHRQRRVFDFYTATFAVNFLGEQGPQFNRDLPPPIGRPGG
jgi:hypothetical protein